MISSNPEWYFIVNPRAGSGKTMSEWVPAEKKLEKLGIPYFTAYTDYKRHATYLARKAASLGYRRICAVGGDGSVHEVMNGIISWCDENKVSPSEFCVAVAPIGSGNDWIKSTGVPHDVSKVIDLISKESFMEADVVRVTCDEGKTCVMTNIGGVGFDSHVCERVNFQKERGKRSKRIYLTALWHTAIGLRHLNVKVIADGTTVFDGQIYSLAIGNGRYSGSGLRQVPLARLDDGLLDFTIVPRSTLLAIAGEVPKLLNGTLNESTKVICGQCRTLQVIPTKDDSYDIVEMDGEIEGKLPLLVELKGERINVLTGLRKGFTKKKRG